MIFELPVGYLDANGGLHTTIDVLRMTGEDEEILSAKNLPVMKKLNKILSRCTTAIGTYRDPRQIDDIVQDLTQGDRVYLLFAILRVSLRHYFPFSSRFPPCL
mgnify:CR=1 FL=1